MLTPALPRQLILTLGNFLNASGHKGNARGFKVTSINKLVDTKSAYSTERTLLHFVAKTVTLSMPETEDFIEELRRPAEAFKCEPRPRKRHASPADTPRLAADLSSVRVHLGELRTQQDALKELLEGSFLDATDLDPDDGFVRKMFRFSKEAEERLDSLKDLVTVANNTYVEALKFYGEDTKSIASTEEFFRVFKTFVDSYKVRSSSLLDRRESALIPLSRSQIARQANKAAADAKAKAALIAVSTRATARVLSAHPFLDRLAKPKRQRLTQRRPRRATLWSKRRCDSFAKSRSSRLAYPDGARTTTAQPRAHLPSSWAPIRRPRTISRGRRPWRCWPICRRRGCVARVRDLAAPRADSCTSTVHVEHPFAHNYPTASRSYSRWSSRFKDFRAGRRRPPHQPFVFRA